MGIGIIYGSLYGMVAFLIMLICCPIQRIYASKRGLRYLLVVVALVPGRVYIRRRGRDEAIDETVSVPREYTVMSCVY